MNAHAVLSRYQTGFLGGRRNISRPALLCVLLTATVAGCGCNRELEVFPQRLQVEVNTAGTSAVDVWARYRNTKNGEILDVPLTWDVPTGVEIAFPTSTDRDASLVVPSASAAVYRITVRGGGASDELVVEVVAPAGDHASALESAIPSVAMSVVEQGNCPADHTVAFVRRGGLEARASNCLTPDVARLSGYAPPMRGAMVWTPGSDPVDFPTTAVVRKVPVRVWILYNAETFANSSLSATEISAILATRATRVDEAILVANGIFAASRVGTQVDRAGPAVTLLSSARTCGELLALVARDDYFGGDAGDVWQQNAINVYVVDAYTDARGQYCRPLAGAEPRNVIRLQTNALQSTLAHELGHLWGLVVPWGENGKFSGHVDQINGFAQDNVMWGRVNLATTAARTRLSLGQVYRMNFDLRSHLSAGSTTDCGCDPYGTACRRLSHDVRPLKRSNGALGASAAYCEAP